MKTYQLKQTSLKPDKYGNNIIVKMVTEYKDGKFVKHIKLDDRALAILESGQLCHPQQLEDAEAILDSITKDSNPDYIYNKVEEYRTKYK